MQSFFRVSVHGFRVLGPLTKGNGWLNIEFLGYGSNSLQVLGYFELHAEFFTTSHYQFAMNFALSHLLRYLWVLCGRASC